MWKDVVNAGGARDSAHFTGAEPEQALIAASQAAENSIKRAVASSGYLDK